MSLSYCYTCDEVELYGEKSRLLLFEPRSLKETFRCNHFDIYTTFNHYSLKKSLICGSTTQICSSLQLLPFILAYRLKRQLHVHVCGGIRCVIKSRCRVSQQFSGARFLQPEASNELLFFWVACRGSYCSLLRRMTVSLKSSPLSATLIYRSFPSISCLMSSTFTIIGYLNEL